MAVNLNLDTDRGIVLYAEHSGDANTFTKANGVAGTPRTLTNANYINSDEFAVGLNGQLAISITGAISVGMASAIVIVEVKRRDVQNTSVPKWTVVGTVRGDSPSTAPAASQTITRANLAGQSVDEGSGAATEVLGVRLMTADALGATVARVIVKATNATNAGDKIIVSVDAR